MEGLALLSLPDLGTPRRTAQHGDGPPGTQVLWRGLQHLDVAVQMYNIFTLSPAPRIWRSYPEGYLSRPQAP